VWAVAIGRSPIGADSDMRLEIGRFSRANGRWR